MPNYRLRETLRPLAGAMLPAKEVRRQQAVRSAIADDGNIRPEAIRNVTPYAIAPFFLPGALVVGTDQALAYRMPHPARVKKIDAIVKAAPTGGNLAVRVTCNGAELGIVTIQSGQLAGASGLDAAVNAGDVLRVDVVAVGPTTPGSGLSVGVAYLPILN